jgi:hypothetical protein
MVSQRSTTGDAHKEKHRPRRSVQPPIRRDDRQGGDGNDGLIVDRDIGKGRDRAGRQHEQAVRRQHAAPERDRDGGERQTPQQGLDDPRRGGVETGDDEAVADEWAIGR